MVLILFGCAAVWGLVTAVSGGNWQVGLLVAVLVLFYVVSGARDNAESRRREARQQAMDDFLLGQEPTRKRWW